ncbi:hypothetical protein TNCV_932361 [Trichonephila clavipes]|nr:hypothetical protein TNCV_932361 [Trichonephila clavipes]
MSPTSVVELRLGEPTHAKYAECSNFLSRRWWCSGTSKLPTNYEVSANKTLVELVSYTPFTLPSVRGVCTMNLSSEFFLIEYPLTDTASRKDPMTRKRKQNRIEETIAITSHFWPECKIKK